MGWYFPWEIPDRWIGVITNNHWPKRGTNYQHTSHEETICLWSLMHHPWDPWPASSSIFVNFKELVRFSQTFSLMQQFFSSLFGSPNDCSTSEHSHHSRLAPRRWARPISLWMVGWNKGHWVENVEISAFCGFCSPKRGKIFVNRNFPRLKWVDYFFKMNCWDSPGGGKWFVLLFAAGAGWKWLEDVGRLYICETTNTIFSLQFSWL